jgi:benzodiazapine receptor
MQAPAATAPQKYISLIICVAVLLGIGALSAWLGNSGPSPWYDALIKSPLNPPPPVFGIVWTIIYALMGISLWLLFQSPATLQRSRAVTAFALQLAVNFAWTWVFFDRHWLGLAVLHVLVLQVCLVAFFVLARRVSPWAAWITVPYLLWTVFALYLSFEAWRLNA